jgi:hypothetical protein
MVLSGGLMTLLTHNKQTFKTNFKQYAITLKCRARKISPSS